MPEVIFDVVPEDPEVQAVAQECSQPPCKNIDVTTAVGLKAAGTSPKEEMNTCSWAAGSDCSYTKAPALSPMMPIVTNGVVRDGITSRMGIMTASIMDDPKMTCPSCGTQIAEKALICFRCGAAVDEPRRAAAAVETPAPRRPVLATLALLVLAAAGLFLGQATGDAVPPWVGWTVATVTLVVVAWRVLWRR